MLGTLGTPASLPSRVVTILESICWRSAAGGRISSILFSPMQRSVSSSNITRQTFPLSPCSRAHVFTSSCASSVLQMSSIDSNSCAGRCFGTNTRGWVPSNESNQLT